MWTPPPPPQKNIREASTDSRNHSCIPLKYIKTKNKAKKKCQPGLYKLVRMLLILYSSSARPMNINILMYACFCGHSKRTFYGTSSDPSKGSQQMRLKDTYHKLEGSNYCSTLYGASVTPKGGLKRAAPATSIASH